MKIKFFFLIMIILSTFACSTNRTNPEKWSDEEVNEWFGKKEWLAGWEAVPDASINKRKFAIEYHRNPRHWNQAFTFLKEADLQSLPVGKQELEGDHLFVAVSEYNSKKKGETKYESHKKYIDIQYVISGKELIGLTTPDLVEVSEPYNEENDITFYNFEGGDYLQADPAKFFIFFPEDVHRPSIQDGESVPVKKAVVKILME